MTTPLSPPVSLLGGSALRAPAKSGTPDEAAIRETAREFESLLLKQLVAAMRSTTMSEEESGGQLVDHLLEDGLASHLARSGGIGLADYLTRDFAPESEVAADAEATSRPPSLPTAALLGRWRSPDVDTAAEAPENTPITAP
jgi:flagellar protein FlgJ